MQDDVKKELGPLYNPIRWLLRRVLNEAKTDEVMLFIGAVFSKGVD